MYSNSVQIFFLPAFWKENTFYIVNIPIQAGNIARAATYGVYISQLIRVSREIIGIKSWLLNNLHKAISKISSDMCFYFFIHNFIADTTH